MTIASCFIETSPLVYSATANTHPRVKVRAEPRERYLGEAGWEGSRSVSEGSIESRIDRLLK